MKSWGWAWLIAGLGIGIGLGLWIGWGLLPLNVAEGTPLTLRRDYRNEYLFLTAMAYQVEGDREQALTRLSALDSEAPVAPLVALTELQIAQQASRPLVTILARLAQDLDAATPAMAPYLTPAPEPGGP